MDRITETHRLTRVPTERLRERAGGRTAEALEDEFEPRIETTGGVEAAGNGPNNSHADTNK